MGCPGEMALRRALRAPGAWCRGPKSHRACPFRVHFREVYAVTALDLDLDLSTPMGEAMANMAVTVAQLERRLIGQRTVAAMKVANKKGIHCG